MFGCKHKFGRVEDRYQYCDKCGTAKAAPARECEHVWQEVTQMNTTSRLNGSLQKITYVMKCTKCANMKTFDVV